MQLHYKWSQIATAKAGVKHQSIKHEVKLSWEMFVLYLVENNHNAQSFFYYLPVSEFRTGTGK
jgi:hypothetical protein